MAKHLKTDAGDLTLANRCLQALEQLGLEGEFLPHRRNGARQHVRAPDLRLRVKGPWGTAIWNCELKRRVMPEVLGPTLHHIRVHDPARAPGLLMTEHVTPGIAKELRRLHAQFIDAAGNAFLERDGLFIWVTGNRPERVHEREPRRLHTASLKLLCVLLQHDPLLLDAMNHRDLAQAAGIALGGVGRILREFERREWIRRTGPDAMTLQPEAAMLRRWDEGYAEILRPRLFLQACRMKKGGQVRDLVPRLAKAKLHEHVTLGGELGAALLTEHLRPTTATLHIADIEAREVMRRLDLLPDRAGDVVLIRAFGTRNATLEKAKKAAHLADPLLQRAELLVRRDDRLREVAEMLRTEHIEPRWV